MTQSRRLKGWRRISGATWGHPNDPQVYGDLDVDAGAMLRFIEHVREATGVRLTVTHVVGKALAHALGEHPDLNGRIYRGRWIPRDTVDIFFIVSAGGGEDLSGVKVSNAATTPVVEIASEIARRADRIRAGDDSELGGTKDLLDRIPLPLLKVGLRLAAWLTADRDLDLSRFGLPRQTFGSAMVSSVGMFGIQHAYAPLSRHYRIPLLVLVGEVSDRPVAVGGAVEIRPMVTLSATIDHRYLDGFHAARLARSLQSYCADPGAFEPPPRG